MDFTNRQTLISTAFTYPAYRQHIEDILRNNTKPDSYGKYADYTRHHIQVMNGYDQSTRITEALQGALNAAPPTTWLVLTEGWCGDASFSTPVLAKLEEIAPANVTVRFLLRDEHLDVMDAYLTDGGRSIPKVIVLGEDLQELGTWGPRPASLHTLMHLWKSEGLELRELLPKVQAWYDADQTKELQAELLQLVKSYSLATV